MICKEILSDVYPPKFFRNKLIKAILTELRNLLKFFRILNTRKNREQDIARLWFVVVGLVVGCGDACSDGCGDGYGRGDDASSDGCC